MPLTCPNTLSVTHGESPVLTCETGLGRDRRDPGSLRADRAGRGVNPVGAVPVPIPGKLSPAARCVHTAST